MADQTVKNILSIVQCESLIPVFEENDIDYDAFILLTKSDLEQLVTSIGKRVKILNYIQKLSTTYNIEANIDNTVDNNTIDNNTVDNININLRNSESEIEIIETVNINEERQNIVSQDDGCGTSCSTENDKENISNQDVACNTEKPKDIVKCGASVYRGKCDNADVFNLHELLQKTCIGQGIIKEYEKNNILSKKSRNSLVSLIINHFLDDSIILSNSNIRTLAIKISDLFPNETSETYYVPPTKPYGGGRKISIARGKLVDKYRNQLRDLRKCGLLPKRKLESEVKITVCNSDCNDSFIWLKNNREPFTDVMEHWNKTYVKREQSLVGSVAQFVKDWPILSLPNAYILIDIDFARKYPHAVNSIYQKFDNVIDHVLLNHLPKKSGGTGLKYLLDTLTEKSISDNHRDLIRFQILPYILPQNGLIKSKVKWKPSIVETQLAFISIVKIPGEIENLIEERRNFCTDKGITLQPFVLVVFNENVFSSYVVIDDLKYEVATVRKAVDICFKSFQVFNAKYPAECEKVWYFLQRALYGFETEFDCKSPSVLTILNSMKAFANNKE